MSADIINLRQARKRKTRTEADTRAAENRRSFGRSKAERADGEARAKAARRHLDAHRLDKDPSRHD
jgi:hypothetical protein